MKSIIFVLMFSVFVVTACNDNITVRPEYLDTFRGQIQICKDHGLGYTGRISSEMFGDGESITYILCSGKLSDLEKCPCDDKKQGEK